MTRHCYLSPMLIIFIAFLYFNTYLNKLEQILKMSFFLGAKAKHLLRVLKFLLLKTVIGIYEKKRKVQFSIPIFFIYFFSFFFRLSFIMVLSSTKSTCYQRDLE